MAPLRVLDPRVLDRHLDRYRKGRRTLTDLCAHYGVTLEGAHDAAADALAALEVVRALGRRFSHTAGAHPRGAAHPAGRRAAPSRSCAAWFTRTGSEECVDPQWPVRRELPTAA